MLHPAGTLQQGLDHAVQRLTLHQNGIHGVADGHIQLLLFDQPMNGLGGKVALDYGAHFLQCLFHRHTTAHQKAEPAVSGVVGYTSDDQVAHARQTGKGLGLAAQQLTQTGHLGDAAGHQHGLGVVTVAIAVGNTHSHRHDILHGTAQLGADDVGRGIHTEIVGRQGLLHQFCRLPGRRGRQNSSRNPPADFFGVRRAGERHHGTAHTHFPHQRVGKQAAVVLQIESLAQKHQHLTVLQQRRQQLCRFTDAKGGHSQHYDGAALHTGQIVGEFNVLGHGNTAQQLGVAAFFPQHDGRFRLMAPHGQAVSGLCHALCHGKTPAAAADHCDLHRGFLLAMTVLGSSPRSNRLMLERWHQISQLAASAT